MADRFPLAVNYSSRKIEEFVSGDNLDLTGNGIIVNGDVGVSGQYLKSTGSGLVWDNPGDVYLTASQTLTNKTLTNCNISGSTNIFTNIPNNALTTPFITVNGEQVTLGSSIGTADSNTTYTISARDGGTSSQKIIRLTSGGTNSGVDDDVVLVAGSNITLSREEDAITINSSFTDTDTVTSLQAATGGSLVSGDITIAASGSSSVSQNGNIITISSTYVDTITTLRAGTGQTAQSGDFTLLSSGATTLSQSGKDITISSVDTITRIKGGGTGTFVSGDILLQGSGAASVSQSGTTVTINATDTNTVTRLKGGAGGTLVSGDITILASGAAAVTQIGNQIEISATNTDTGALLQAGTGLALGSNTFSIKNSSNLSDNKIIKWDGGNSQIANSIITDDGSTVTIEGDFVVTGTNTIINTSTLQVADNSIELRRGNNLTGSNGGIQINRTTNSTGVVLTFSQLQFFEGGNYWRVWDGSIARRLVTDNEVQTLTNKTLTSPILTSPTLGAATATTINGVTITPGANSVLTIADTKTAQFSNTVRFFGTDNSNVNYRSGGNVAYTGDTLAVFSTTTSTQLRGVVSDATGVGILVFNQNPVFVNSITTTSTAFDIFNTQATQINAFGGATAINFGASTGTTTINHNLTVAGNVEFNEIVGDTFTVYGTANFDNADIIIRGGSSNPIKIGRGGNDIASNTRVGYGALEANTTGTKNTAFGFESLLVNNTAEGCVALGYRSQRTNLEGVKNVSVGSDSMLSTQNGRHNVAIGTSALESNVSGNNNVCIGHFAGYGLLGSGNVLIGASGDENSTNATYAPPSISGSNQLVIGSGTEAWIRGDSSFNLTAPNNLTVGGNATISGNLIVNGTTTTVNSNTVSIDDKNLELAAVVNTTFQATVVDGSPNISAITPTTGLIPGMEINIVTGGLSVPLNTTIISILGNTAILSNSVSGSGGTATIEAYGPSDLGADGGGLILRGNTNKTILYDHSRTDKYWTFSENLEIASGKKFVIGNQLVLNTTTLGSTVVNSSLTSVGTLTGLTVEGAVEFGGRVIESNINNFTTALTPSANTLTINVAASNTVLGTPATTAINTWAFTGANLENGESITITLIIDSNTAAIYGDACTVDGNPVGNGVRWSGGSPPTPTSNTDILTFVIVRDNSGVTRVFGQGNTDFS
jgi:hypothetical protein